MIFTNWSSNYFGNYSGKLNTTTIVAKAVVIRNERKYNLMRPIWVEVVVERFC